MKRLSVKQWAIVGGTLLLIIAAVITVVILSRTVTVPNVKGLGVTAATEVLEKSGFSVEKKDIFSDRVPKNVVIMQDVSPGTELSVYSDNKVVITVSKGIEQIMVPRVTGKPKDEAIRTLTELGFRVTYTNDFDNEVVEGSVISQSLDARRNADKGSEISLVISLGAKSVVVPRIQGLSRAEAVLAMDAAGLTLKTEFETSSSVKEDYVISQSVEAGALIPASVTITAKISLGKIGNKVGSTPSNAKDQPFVTSQGDWIYFVDIHNSYDLYRMRKNGSVKQLLYSGTVDNVNVVGGWVYFTDAAQCYNPFKIQIDGTGLKRLGTDNVFWLYAVEDTLYTADSFDGGNIHKRDTNGNNRTLVFSENYTSINIYGSSIYYVSQNDNKVYRIDTDGKNRKMIYEYNNGCNEIAMDNGILYITTNDSLIKYDTKSERAAVIDTDIYKKRFINVSNGWIYYEEMRSSTPTHTIAAYCRMRTNGTQKTTVFDVNDRNPGNMYLIVIDEWLYFPNQEDNLHTYRVYKDGTKLQRLIGN